MSRFWSESVPWTFADLPESERPSYEQRRRMRYSLQDYMEKEIRFEEWRGRKVLDVGCGSGIDAMEFARNGADIWGVDPSPLAVSEAGKLLGPRISQARAERLPFEDEKFDLVYCFGVLHHLRHPDRALSEFRRVLIPGGRVLAMVYNRNSLLWAYSKYHRVPIEKVSGVPTVTPFTSSEAIRLFARFFGGVSVRTFYQVVDLPGLRKIKLDIPDHFGLGWHHIIRGTKI